MPEWLNNFHLIFWGSMTLIAIVPTIAYYWHKTRKIELETELKREMIQRGMSADEIIRILQASSKQRRDMADEEVEEPAH
jgi:hypothetical protein